MADNTKNITADDVTNWLRNAPVEQIMRPLTEGINKIATGPAQYHERFVGDLSPQARKLFEGQPVG